MALTSGVGRNGSIGLRVTASSSAAYLWQGHVTKAAEGYLTFWFNPNNVALPEPSPNYWPPSMQLTLTCSAIFPLPSTIPRPCQPAP
jgi:hypothetical protein